jgi:phosphatidylglycerophosphate synthase
MYRYIPNLITIARLVLTVVFFIVLNVHEDATFHPSMWVAFVVFLLAVSTDWIDGYLARKWKVESAFGRVVDPFADKIMICGAFIFFSSDDFINLAAKSAAPNPTLGALTGVAPWMAVVLIGREFLITGIRGLAESRGIDFRADWAGKIKMTVQCIAVGAVLFHIATRWKYLWVWWVRDGAIWVTLVVTVASATTYIIRARRLIKE